MRLSYLLAFTASILALTGAGAARQAKQRVNAPPARSLATDDIDDSTKTGVVEPGATGPRVVRAQILLDRAKFSPGEIDGVYGDDFGIAVKVLIRVRLEQDVVGEVGVDIHVRGGN